MFLQQNDRVIQNFAEGIAMQFLTSPCSIKEPRSRHGEQEKGGVRPDVKLEKHVEAPVSEGVLHHTNELLPCLQKLFTALSSKIPLWAG